MNKNFKSHWLYHELENIISSPETIKRRVEEATKYMKYEISTGIKKTKHKKRDLVADYLIKKKTEINTAIGALTGAVGVIPIIGTVGAVVTTVTVELITVTHQEIELCLEIAHTYGHNITDENRMLEILALISKDVNKGSFSKRPGKTVIYQTMDSVIKRYARIGMLRALKRTARRLGLKFGLRAFAKLIPILGVVLGGAINYRVTKNTGFLAKQFYGINAL